MVAYRHKMVLFIFNWWLQLSRILSFSDICGRPHCLPVMVSDFKSSPITIPYIFYSFHPQYWPGCFVSFLEQRNGKFFSYSFSFLSPSWSFLFWCFECSEEGRKEKREVPFVNWHYQRLLLVVFTCLILQLCVWVLHHVQQEPPTFTVTLNRRSI